MEAESQWREEGLGNQAAGATRASPTESRAWGKQAASGGPGALTMSAMSGSSGLGSAMSC